MLAVPKSSVFGSLKVHLESSQDAIDKESDYSLRVENARNAWKKKNEKIFSEIRDLLIKNCHGARRCNYCEDSVADEIEHIWPKYFYPNKTFVWGNFLFACGPCNGSNKRDQFALFDSSGEVVELIRRKGDLVSMPPPGTIVFIDQREDDPLEFIELDLDTGIFIPIAIDEKDSKYIRAAYSIKTLGLNTRDYLIRARKNAYASFLDSSKQYVAQKISGASCAELTRRAKEITDRHHPSVWAEMKRQANSSTHKPIFDVAPELLYF